MGTPGRQVHRAGVQLERMIGHSFGARGRSTKDLGSLAVWVNELIHLHGESQIHNSLESKDAYLGTNLERKGASVVHPLDTFYSQKSE